MIGFGSPMLNRRYDAWRTMSEDDYYADKYGDDSFEDEPDAKEED